MKVFLLHRDRDLAVKPALRDGIFDAMHSANLFAITNVKRELERRERASGRAAPTSDDLLAQDLELATLWEAMAAGDEFLLETAKRVVLSSLTEPEAIEYRQDVLADCLRHPDVVRQIYALALEALESERKVGGGVWRTDRPDMILHRSVQILTLHVDVLKRLRRIAEEEAERLRSDGFTRFFAMLREELADEYLATLEEHLRELEFKRGVLESAELGKGNKGRHYVVRRQRERRWTERLPFANRSPGLSFTIPPRDESGFRALEEIRGRGINGLANAVAQSADHVKSFFVMLRLELAFYLGCVNLREQLDEKGEPTCFPTPLPAGAEQLAARGLFDVSLSLRLEGRVVGNEVDADGKALVVVTGANQGGKSTFLRGLGLAQLMMQSGMFVGAESFRASVCTGVFTHFKREEDATMAGGKLDEELSRMSAIADAIAPCALLLCNESFASTNEREGSEIARQVVRAMLAKRIRVVFVTHMYDLAHGFCAQRLDTALFLRAEREPDGRRTYRLLEGEPLPTSYGEDSYRRIFGTPAVEPAPLAEPRS
jgi:DNA mismatch repair ATPase MutS